MARTIDEHIAVLESQRDTLQDRLTAMAADTTYVEPGSLVNAPSGGADHAEYFRRWETALEKVTAQLEEAYSQQPYIRESRGV